ncbi:sterol desaturase family protein [Paraglaciecola aquimarina]|uniref:Sterol desaturase family protein n=1 Tax=Paraglaciecola aquimarina TaxID=1235557 RepID=A0ABU3SX93_9ALTE|nr:sterol desaturase family protein [Paraglaciecola aquimarina]MDU0354620.1 sterol desaturase family protein [Paraglaciecola aquimarina]
MPNELWLRMGSFIIVLIVMMVWEAISPNLTSKVANYKRWSSNFFLAFCGAMTGRLLVPAGLAVVAIFADKQHFGVLNILPIPEWTAITLAVIALDCLIYWQHRVFHRVPLLWRLHRVHHADPHLDASTGLRFHPIEIALSLVIKGGAIMLLGVPVLAILIFEIVLNASAIFNHSNITLPNWLEKPLRKVIVTQAMHRIHHSQVVTETDSNFGFCLSTWDRLFGSYTHEAKAGDHGLTLGLQEYSKESDNTGIGTLLLMPFRKKPRSCAAEKTANRL